MMDSVVSLQQNAHLFVRQFGLVCAAWVALLAISAPAVREPNLLWWTVGLVAGWSVIQLVVQNETFWFFGWLSVGSWLEVAGPVAGTPGWSVVGGVTFLTLAHTCILQRRWASITAVTVFIVAASSRPFISDSWVFMNSVATSAIFIAGTFAMFQVFRLIYRTVEEREQLASELSVTRQRAAVADANNESAARLHDSVLQTLTQMQREQGGKQQELADQAVRQMRNYLAGKGQVSDGSFHTMMRSLSEQARVKVILFGPDVELDMVEPVFDAAREAVRNALQHTGSDVHVTCETDGGRVTVTVRDEGPGFSLEGVPDTHHGIRNSIMGRMERSGGSAFLETSPDGSEWTLSLPYGSSQRL